MNRYPPSVTAGELEKCTPHSLGVSTLHGVAWTRFSPVTALDRAVVSSDSAGMSHAIISRLDPLLTLLFPGLASTSPTGTQHQFSDTIFT